MLFKTDRTPFGPGRAFGALRALAIGIAAVAAGAFVGFLVNGPPQRPAPPRAAAAETAAAPEAAALAPTPPAVEPRDAAAPPAPAPGPLVFAEVREVQGRLRAVGFAPGPLDGSAGPTTANAARQYQRARGLAVTGEVDRDLLARLREERTAAPPPPPPRRRYQTATAQPRPRNGFFDDLDRLFRR